jgi:hypothetical protein
MKNTWSFILRLRFSFVSRGLGTETPLVLTPLLFTHCWHPYCSHTADTLTVHTLTADTLTVHTYCWHPYCSHTYCWHPYCSHPYCWHLYFWYPYCWQLWHPFLLTPLREALFYNKFLYRDWDSKVNEKVESMTWQIGGHNYEWFCVVCWLLCC